MSKMSEEKREALNKMIETMEHRICAAASKLTQEFVLKHGKIRFDAEVTSEWNMMEFVIGRKFAHIGSVITRGLTKEMTIDEEAVV